MSVGGSGRSFKYYKPEGVGTINYISAIGDNVILISEGGYYGRILEYNTETNQVIHRVTNEWRIPGKVSVVQAGGDTKYIVKCLSSKMRWVVNIYNKDWNLISTIDIFADALTVTHGGKLLIAHNNRIHEYSQEGRFIRRQLDEYKFYNIQDMTYSGGCLWVLESMPTCIKIFQLS